MSNSIAEVLDTIKKHSWITNMGDRYLNKWIALANKYAPKLDEIPIKKKLDTHDMIFHIIVKTFIIL